MNWGIILVTIAISVWGWKYPSNADPYELNAREPHLANYFTYAFLHQPGPPAALWLSIHLLGNMLALWVFGPTVNDRLGHAGYLAFYLAGAVFAGVGCVVLPPAASPRVIGASGAVMGIVGAYLVLFPRSHVIWGYFFGVASGVIEVPAMYLVSFFVALDVAMSLAGSSGVAHIAHVWGAALGIAVTLGLLWVRLLPRDPFDLLALAHRWNRRREYQRLVARGFDPFAAGAMQPDAPAAPSASSGASRPGRRRRRDEDGTDPRRVEKIKELRAQVYEALAHHNLPHAAILFLELKAIDPNQVLSRQAQLDVANQLASQQFYEQAAEAYEQFLRHYPNYAPIENVQLMLGLIYARYLDRPARARQLLQHALQRLHGEPEQRLAREALQKLRA